MCSIFAYFNFNFKKKSKPKIIFLSDQKCVIIQIKNNLNKEEAQTVKTLEVY